MLQRPASFALLAGAALLATPAGSGPASADVLSETIYLPTGSVVTLPSTAPLPTSYFVPTSSVSSFVPTSTIYTTGEVVVPTATSYVVPTYYSPARYRRRRFVERRAYYSTPVESIVATSYLAPMSYLAPTSYVVPTRYLSTSYVGPTSYLVDSGLMTTSGSASLCCESSPSPSPSSSSAPSRTPTMRPVPSNGGSGGGTIMSTPSTGQSGERMPSGEVDDGVPNPINTQAQTSTTQTPPPPKPVQATPVSPRTGDGAEPGPIVVPEAGKIGGGLPPVDTKPDQTSFRDSRRFAYAPAGPRNVLRGRVLSFDSGRPEESVTVIVASKTGSFVDRTALTDADGEFKVSLPTGDWVVKVRMPSGSVLAVGRDYLTASSGRITDPTGRNVDQFTITR